MCICTRIVFCGILVTAIPAGRHEPQCLLFTSAYQTSQVSSENDVAADNRLLNRVMDRGDVRHYLNASQIYFFYK